MKHEKHIGPRRRRDTVQLVRDKLDVMEHWCKHGLPWLYRADGKPEVDQDGEMVLAPYPTDVKAFALWSGKVTWTGPNPSHENELGRFGRSTINQPDYDTLRRAFDDVLARLKSRARFQLEQKNKRGIIDAQKAEIEYLGRVKKEQEREVVLLRREADGAKRALGIEHALRLRGEAELIRRIAELETTVAELRRTTSGVRVLKGGKQ